MNILEYFQSTCNVSRQPGKFTDNLERFQATWRVSRQPRKFLDNLESLHTAWKDSRQPGLFPDNHKVSRQPGKFFEKLPDIDQFFIYFILQIMYAMYDVRTYMPQKRFGLFFG